MTLLCSCNDVDIEFELDNIPFSFDDKRDSEKDEELELESALELVLELELKFVLGLEFDLEFDSRLELELGSCCFCAASKRSLRISDGFEEKRGK